MLYLRTKPQETVYK